MTAVTIDDIPHGAHGARRWSDEQVVALAPRRIGSARAIAEPSVWSGLGAHGAVLWGACHGSGREPYAVLVDHVHLDQVQVVSRCSCPSRQRPCKHALALLLLWAHGHVPDEQPPPNVAAWAADVAMRADRAAAAAAASSDSGDAPAADAAGAPGAGEPTPPAGSKPPPSRDRDGDRANRVSSGLVEFDRWLVDRMRGGLADPELASYVTWDAVAARLVDAQAPALANRVRRVGAIAGTRPGWHEHVLAELGVMHLIARAGQRIGLLGDPLADGVAAAVGWTVRQADVLAGTPDTDCWLVAGRSDTLEDRIVVRRLWLHGAQRGWVMLLSFAAYGQSLDDWPRVGAVIDADIHRYPGTVRLRGLLGRVHDQPGGGVDPQPVSVAAACSQVGEALAAEPWLERYPITVLAAPTVADGRWWLTDHSGSVPIAEMSTGDEMAVLLAASASAPVSVTAEWTAGGVVPLAVHLPDRTVDIGPRGGFDGPRWGSGR